MAKKLLKKIFIDGKLVAKTGLHIGGSNMSMAIGGADAVVVRNPISNEPYIPGSSIKGKMRSLTEKLLGAYQEGNMGVVKCVPYDGTEDKDATEKQKELRSIVYELYGRAKQTKEENLNIPSRIIVRDAYMSKASSELLKNSEYTDMPFTEVKTEVVIDRVTAAAVPRQLERVPAGTEFEFSLVLNVFEEDDDKKEKNLLKYVKIGLRLMEDDYLGGKGSRGSGQVAIDWDNLKITFKDLQTYENNMDAEKYEETE